MVHTDSTTVQCQNPVTYTRMLNGPYKQYESSVSKSGDTLGCSMVHTDSTTVQCQNPVTYTTMFNGPYRQNDSSVSKSGDLHSDVQWSIQTEREFSVKIP